LGNRNRQIKEPPKRQAGRPRMAWAQFALGEGGLAVPDYWQTADHATFLCIIHAMEKNDKQATISSELFLFMQIHGIQDLKALIGISESDLFAMDGFSVHLLLEIDVFRTNLLRSDSDLCD
jgi:hypothetical protein